MKNIIAYSAEKLYRDFEKADELFLSSGMKDMELYEKQLAEAARKAAAEHMAALYSDMDRMLCEDISRTEKYTIQRHDERQLLTTVGPVCFTHTLFRSRKDGTCHYLLDEWMELDAHERLSSRAEAEVLAEAVKTSYASASRVLGEDSVISKTAVMDKVHGIQTELPFPKPEKKKCVEYLYIEADEDHIHKQEKTETGKKGSMIGKLLYLYEGKEKKDGRKKLKNVFYLGGLCSGGEANRHLFERMQEYIDTNYESRYLNAVYISGDGGAWIKAGAEYIEKGVPVLDKFHMMKYINKTANQMLDEAGEAKGRLWKALYKGKKKKFVKTIKAIRKCAPNEKAVNDCEEYLLNNWDSAVRRMQDKNVYGCSAEGHVSHMYSDRMSSRPMGWSEAGADAMCQLRCYVKDYGEEKILELVKYRRSHKQEEATGTEEISVRPNRGYMRSLLLHSHDNDRVYIEKLQATIPSIDIRKKLAIRERLGGI